VQFDGGAELLSVGGGGKLQPASMRARNERSAVTMRRRGSSMARTSSSAEASPARHSTASNTLRGSGEQIIEAEDFGGPVLEAEAPEAGQGEDGRVVLTRVHLRDAGVNVAADRSDFEVGADLAELGLATGGAGAHDRALAEALERDLVAADEGVSGILPQGHGGDGEALGALRGKVLVAVDGDVDFATLEGFLDGGGEPADAFGERSALVLVSGGGDGDEIDPQVRVAGAEGGGD
jgi:hypothetical protein